MQDADHAGDHRLSVLPPGVTIIQPPRQIQILTAVLFFHAVTNTAVGVVACGFTAPIALTEADAATQTETLSRAALLVGLTLGPTIPLTWMAAIRMTRRPRSARTYLILVILLSGLQAVGAMYVSLEALGGAVSPFLCCPMFVLLEAALAVHSKSRRWLRILEL